MEEATLFLDRIPKGTQYHEVRELLQYHQGVRRIFLSNKRRKSSFAFGFIEFYREGQMQNAVSDLNGRFFRGSSIFARPAYKPLFGDGIKQRFPKKSKRQGSSMVRNDVSKNSFDLRKWIEQSRTQRDHLLIRGNEQYCMTKIDIKLTDEWKRKLLKGIIIVLKSPKETNEVKDDVKAVWSNWEEILPLSNRKFLVTFKGEYECAIACTKVNQRREELPFFVSWWGNKSHRQNFERLAWIEVTGLPLIAWEHQNICKIAEVCGVPIKILLGEEVGHFIMDVGVLLRTSIKSRIDQVISLYIDGDEEYKISLVERCVGREWQREEFLGEKLSQHQKEFRRDWPSLSAIYSNNNGIGAQGGGEGISNGDRDLQTFVDAVRGEKKELQGNNVRINGLINLEREEESSSVQSIDLNRNPREKQILDLDPSMFRSEHVNETQSLSRSCDFSIERSSNTRCLTKDQTIQMEEQMEPASDQIREADQNLVMGGNDQIFPRNNDQMHSQQGVGGEGEDRRDSHDFVSSAQDDVELARLVNLQIGQVEILSRELQQGIERRESLPVVWEVDKQLEEEDEECFDNQEDVVEEVRTRKGKGFSKCKNK